MGAKVIDRLLRDLCLTFPEMKDFSWANLIYMPAFAAADPTSKLSNRLLDNYRGITTLPGVAQIERELSGKPSLLDEGEE